jgi:lipopolysaccharide/colanic/teichoic acid biosynthesis glycosyltransferase
MRDRLKRALRAGAAPGAPGVKRACDILLALGGLTVCLPLGLLAAAAILMDTGLPVLYRQERVGRHGRTFMSLKFRSMRADAEKGTGPIQASASDHRVTRIGRFLRVIALDELPQLANILKGDMSVVGPRALRPLEADAIDGQMRHLRDIPGFAERCTVRPGLTGVAQLLLPRDAPRSAKLTYDVWYVRHCTFPLDLSLFAASLVVTIRARWESATGKPVLARLRARVKRSLPG